MQHQAQYRGVTYVIHTERTPSGGFQGRFRLLDVPAEGSVDALHPPTDPTWATENEAITHATEAACHAIEIAQFGRPQGQGHGSPSTVRRTESLGQ